MKIKDHECTTTLEGVELKINFNVWGEYMPATRYDPEEYPEIEILSVKVSDSEIDILDLFSKKQLEQIESSVYEYCSEL